MRYKNRATMPFWRMGYLQMKGKFLLFCGENKKQGGSVSLVAQKRVFMILKMLTSTLLSLVNHETLQPMQSFAISSDNGMKQKIVGVYLLWKDHREDWIWENACLRDWIYLSTCTSAGILMVFQLCHSKVCSQIANAAFSCMLSWTLDLKILEQRKHWKISLCLESLPK